MSRYSRYPFQPGAAAGGLGAANAHQTVATTHLPPHHHHQHHQHHHQLRNPWVSGVECRESGSTNSSSASSRRGGGPWLHPLDLNHQPARHQHHHLYEQPLDVLGPGSALLPLGHGHAGVSSAPPPQPAHAAASAAPGSSRAASDRDRPTTPASSPGSAGLHGGSAALDGCGGHCVAFENFCYYCLQVVFVLGVLCGVSLTIAGSVLRQGAGGAGSMGGVSHRGRDLVVLVYIGCLLALVCAVLLAVQCCVRRNVKRRKRALRERRARNQPHAASTAAAAAAAPQPFTDLSGDVVPLQELQPAPAPAPAAISQYQPLLVRLVQQQQQQQQQQHHHHMQTLLPERHHQYRYRHSNMTTVDPPLDTSRSGTPWWRRRSDFKQTVIESRH